MLLRESITCSFWEITLSSSDFQMVMILSAGFFRIRSALPRVAWMYPISYVSFHTYSIQVSYCCLLGRGWFLSGNGHLLLLVNSIHNYIHTTDSMKEFHDQQAQNCSIYQNNVVDQYIIWLFFSSIGDPGERVQCDVVCSRASEVVVGLSSSSKRVRCIGGEQLQVGEFAHPVPHGARLSPSRLRFSAVPSQEAVALWLRFVLS